MNPRSEQIFRRVMQWVAIGLLAGIVGMILHKGYADVSMLAREHSGDGLWRAIGRYIFRNLAG